MRMFNGMEISASGMKAERIRLDLVSANIANTNSVKKPGENVYQPQRLVTTWGNSRFNSMLAGLRQNADLGVKVTGVVTENSHGRMVYEPNHPLADENGYVTYPDINVLDEMVAAISASRAYEANITAFNESKKMMNKALDIGRG